MTNLGPLSEGRAAFEERAWSVAFERLAAVPDLDPEDIERLAVAGYLVGRDPESDEAWTKAHHAFLARDDAVGAARCAIWLGFQLQLRGEMAPASGWFGRAGRLLDDREECGELGFLTALGGVRTMFGGDPSAAIETFKRGREISARHGDANGVTLGLLGEGQSLIMVGRVAEGVGLLDEAMVSVTSGEVSPIAAGLIYCALIDACQEMFDVRRAQEWTLALTRWCDAQADLVPFRGQCLVHRADIMQLHGSWPDAMVEVKEACRLLTEPPGHAAAGMAFYSQGDLHRVRGEFDEADAAYVRASEFGRTPQPGIALLRLAMGKTDAAVTAIGRALDDEEIYGATRAKLLPACVEIMLASDDLDAARAAADELGQIAATLDVAYVSALSKHANGAVLLASGQTQEALGALRDGIAAWRDLDVPYEAARARVLVGLASRTLGDSDDSTMEWDAARRTFADLGAAPAIAALDGLMAGASPGTAGLTAREIEVLGHVATGLSNRGIAKELVLSEKTVARHIANIFTKLGVSSRSAATAYAYENHLVKGSRT